MGLVELSPPLLDDPAVIDGVGLGADVIVQRLPHRGRIARPEGRDQRPMLVHDVGHRLAEGREAEEDRDLPRQPLPELAKNDVSA